VFINRNNQLPEFGYRHGDRDDQLHNLSHGNGRDYSVQCGFCSAGELGYATRAGFRSGKFPELRVSAGIHS
jgi:hypothetical protein